MSSIQNQTPAQTQVILFRNVISALKSESDTGEISSPVALAVADIYISDRICRHRVGVVEAYIHKTAGIIVVAPKAHRKHRLLDRALVIQEVYQKRRRAVIVLVRLQTKNTVKFTTAAVVGVEPNKIWHAVVAVVVQARLVHHNSPHVKTRVVVVVLGFG